MKKTAAKEIAVGSSRSDYESVLNFRVTADFRRRFRIYAARHDMTLAQLLQRIFEEYEAKDAA
jgi:hypothetical protein